MLVKSFTARTMPEALDKVRTALGDQALIVETRDVSEPGLLGRRIGVEVVAAIEHAENRPHPRKRTSLGLGAFEARPPPQPEQTHEAWRKIDFPEFDRALPRAETHPQPTAPAATHQPGTDSQARALLQAMASAEPEGEVSQELAAIKRQLARLAAGQGTPSSHLGDELLARLEDVELPVDLIGDLDEAIAQAGERLPQGKRQVFAQKLLAKHITCTDGIDWAHCQNLLLVGATGVGKTTTIAKLAGDLVLRRGRRIALVTIDTYRVGAADQLRAYADLLDVPCEVAQTPAQLQQALSRFQDYDNVLIDTAGRSPADSTRVHELRGFCRAIPELQVLLAISATCGRAEFASVVERFSILPIEHVALTKLDECMAPGRLYGCLRRHRLAVAYCCDGQEVPDDIRPASAGQLVDPLFSRSELVG